MASSESGAKKLKDLRVVDLRRELETRGLDKAGVKAVLSERLQKALEDEGKDPAEYVFESSDSPKRTPGSKKPVSRVSAVKEKKDGDEEEENLEESMLDEEVDDEGANAEDNIIAEDSAIAEDSTVAEDSAVDFLAEDMQILDEDDEDVDEIPEEVQEGEKVEEMEVKDTVEEIKLDPTAETTDVVMEEVKENVPEMVSEVTPEEKPVCEEALDQSAGGNKDMVDVKVKEEPQENQEKDDKNTPVETASSVQTESTVEDTKDNIIKPAEEKEETSPPDPVALPPAHPLTIEDKIKMDTSMILQSDENVSLDVHVDDTQNDLDADLLSGQEPNKGTDSATDKMDTVTSEPDGLKKEEEKVGESKEVVATETLDKQEGVIPSNSEINKDSKVEKSPDKKEDSKTTPSSSTSTSKSNAVQKEVKKDEKSSSGAGRNLWVSGLSSATRATDLKALFSKHGKVVGAKVVTNARSPGSKCYGFVTMSTADEATKCIQHLHRTELHGKMISVERAKNDPGAQAKAATAGSVPAAKKPEPKSVTDKKTPTSTKKDEKDKKEPEKRDLKKDDKKVEEKKEEKKDVKKDDKTPVKKDDRDSRHRDSARRSVGSAEKSRTVVMDKSKGEPVISVGQEKGRDSRAKSAGSSHSRRSTDNKAGDTKKEDALSFEKIQEERERERLRQRERKLREEERNRRQEIERERRRQRDVQMKQRAEAIRLAREREKLRKEREILEKERLEAQRLERLRLEQIERERQEREQEEKRRLQQLRLEQEEQRRALKRTYESRGGRDDNYWSEPKRAAVSDSRYDSQQSYPNRNVFDSRDNRDSRGDNRFNDRNSGVTIERKVERYERHDGSGRGAERQDSRGSRQFDDRNRTDSHRDDRSRNEDRFESRFNDRGNNSNFQENRRDDRGNVRDNRRETGLRDSRDRMRDDRRDLTQDRGRDDRRGREAQRDDRNIGGSSGRGGNAQRHTDNRSDWKSERDNRQNDARVVVRSGQGNVSGSGNRDNWQSGSHSYNNNVQDDRNRNKGFTHNSGAGLLGNAPSNQTRTWGSGTDGRGKMENSWSNSGLDTRVAQSQQDRWTGGVALQQDTRSGFPQTVATGLITSMAPNMYMASVPQQSGMIITGAGIAAGRQPEPRFDAYKSMQSGGLQRRY